jgi:MFS transporter, DHA1 family, inner membrane transport protein
MGRSGWFDPDPALCEMNGARERRTKLQAREAFEIGRSGTYGGISGLNAVLLALAVGSFAIGTTEFSPMGLLPVIAHDMGVSVPKAGGLITAYAIGVMIGAPIVTIALAGVRRKKALVGLMGLYTIGNLMSVGSFGYDTLLLSRVVTSFCQGAFFGLGAVEAAGVVAPEKRGSAVATMFMGLTIANIGGVPFATWLGDSFGWRSAFLATTVLGLIAMLSLSIALPLRPPGPTPDARAEIRVLLRGNVLAALAITAIGAGAMFVLYTYIAPILEHVTNASASVVTVALMLVGVGFSIGNAIGGRSADHSRDGTLLIGFPVLGVMLLAYPFAAGTVPGALLATLLWGAATFAIMPSLQMRVMEAAHEAPGLASSVNIGAFNLGNAIGAALGAVVLSSGLGYPAVSIAGTGLALTGVAAVLASRRAGISPG